MKSIKIVSLILIVLALYSCSVVTEDKELEVPNQIFTFEDIYEGGGNTANAVELKMKELLESNPSLTAENLYEAVLSEVTISRADSLGLSQVKGIKLSFSCDELDMIVVASNNEVSGKENSVKLEVLKDVEIQEYLKQDVIYLTLDIDSRENLDVLEDVNAGIKFDIQVEKE